MVNRGQKVDTSRVSKKGLSIEVMAETATCPSGASPRVDPKEEAQTSTSTPSNPRSKKVRE
ncbi:hypothetical protein KI387_013557, partial [Taxus chinensis]